MNSKVLLAVIGVSLLSVAAWFALQGEATPAAPGALDAPDVAARGDADAALAGGAGAPDADVVEAAADGGDAVRVELATRSSLLPLPDDVAWTEVRVVDGDSREPVAGADVYWFDDSVTEAVGEQELGLPGDPTLWNDLELMATRYGWNATSDERGVVRVHRAKDTKVFARDGARYGFLLLSSEFVPPRDGFVVALAPDASVEVQVVDADGQPVVGVPISIGYYDEAGAFLSPFRWGPMTMSQPPDGRARLPHVQQMPAPEVGGGTHYRVLTALPGYDDPGVRFDREAPPTAPIVLRLPPTGVVAVRAQLRGGQAEMTTSSLDVRDKQKQLRAPFSRGIVRRPDADGWARFSHVPLGKRFVVSADVDGNWLSDSVDGPVAAGAVVEVTLAPSVDAMMLSGRLLREDRSVAADQKFELGVRGEFHHSSELQTDGDGRFVAVLGPRRENNRAERIDFLVAARGEQRLIARAAPRELRVGCEDLGDLVLRPDELVVAGTCTLDGAPAKLTHAWVERQQGGEDDQPDWRWTSDASLTAHDDGTFELRGEVEGARLRLRVRGEDRLPIDPIPFTRGQRDLHVALTSGAGLAATVLVPEGGWQTVQLRLEPTDRAAPVDDGARERLTAKVEGREGGRQQANWRGIEPGTYELTIGLDGFDEIRHVVPDVVVPQPEGGDPRLVDIDLRDRLQLQLVRLFDEAGAPLEQRYEGALFPRQRDDGGALKGLPCWGKEIRALLPKGDTPLLVAISGYRPQQVVCTGAPLDVRLVPWPKAEVRVATGVALPDGCSLEVRLEQLKGDGRRWQSPWSSGSVAELFGPPSRAVAVVDGVAQVPVGDEPRRLLLAVAGRRGRRDVELSAQRVSVTTPAHTLLVDDAKLQAAIDAMQEKAAKE